MKWQESPLAGIVAVQTRIALNHYDDDGKLFWMDGKRYAATAIQAI